MQLLKYVGKVPQFDFKEDVEVLPIGDMHIGHPQFDEQAFKKYIDYTNSNSNAYIALMGDELEAEIPSHSGHWGYEQKMLLDEQLENFYKLIKPISDKKKILTKVSSTHTGWHRKLTGHDIDKEIAEKIGTNYLGIGGYWNAKVGEKDYQFYQQHGASSSKYPQFEIAKAMDVYPTADIYLLGHTHQLDCHPYTKRVAFGDKEFERTQWGIRTGAFVRDKDWAREILLPKPNIGSPIISLNARKKNVKVSLDSI